MPPIGNLSPPRTGGEPPEDNNGLAYRVELWGEGGVRKTVGQAERAAIARAIYDAALREYPSELVVLLRDDVVLARSREDQST
jgi:hypothetical protein